METKTESSDVKPSDRTLDVTGTITVEPEPEYPAWILDDRVGFYQPLNRPLGATLDVHLRRKDPRRKVNVEVVVTSPNRTDMWRSKFTVGAEADGQAETIHSVALADCVPWVPGWFMVGAVLDGETLILDAFVVRDVPGSQMPAEWIGRE